MVGRTSEQMRRVKSRVLIVFSCAAAAASYQQPRWLALPNSPRRCGAASMTILLGHSIPALSSQ